MSNNQLSVRRQEIIRLTESLKDPEEIYYSLLTKGLIPAGPKEMTRIDLLVVYGWAIHGDKHQEDRLNDARANQRNLEERLEWIKYTCQDW